MASPFSSSSLNYFVKHKQSETIEGFTSVEIEIKIKTRKPFTTKLGINLFVTHNFKGIC